jgi:hypothetical protein
LEVDIATSQRHAVTLFSFFPLFSENEIRPRRNFEHHRIASLTGNSGNCF